MSISSFGFNIEKLRGSRSHSYKGKKLNTLNIYFFSSNYQRTVAAEQSPPNLERQLNTKSQSLHQPTDLRKYRRTSINTYMVNSLSYWRLSVNETENKNLQMPKSEERGTTFSMVLTLGTNRFSRQSAKKDPLMSLTEGKET